MPAKPLLHHHETQIAPVAGWHRLPSRSNVRLPSRVQVTSRRPRVPPWRALRDRREGFRSHRSPSRRGGSTCLPPRWFSVPDRGRSPVQRCPSPEKSGLQPDAKPRNGSEGNEPEWVRELSHPARWQRRVLNGAGPWRGRSLRAAMGLGPSGLIAGAGGCSGGRGAGPSVPGPRRSASGDLAAHPRSGRRSARPCRSSAAAWAGSGDARCRGPCRAGRARAGRWGCAGAGPRAGR